MQKQCKKLKSVIKKAVCGIEKVLEPNDEVQLQFAGLISDDLSKHAYILVATDKLSKYHRKRTVLHHSTLRFVFVYIEDERFN